MTFVGSSRVAELVATRASKLNKRVLAAASSHTLLSPSLPLPSFLPITGVTFVGSSRVAELVATRASKLNKRVLAMGGAKNHLVALPDCEVESAASDIVASFAGCAGQRCMVRFGFGLEVFA